MALLWLVSCFTLIGACYGSGAPAGDPELSVMPRIINGMDAVTVYPWHVSLEKPFGWTLCGGSLIDRKWVITVATCRVRPNDWAIAGKYDPHAQKNKIQYIKINKIFRHPEFNISSFYANVALLKLNSKIGIRRTVAPIALPRADDTFPAGSQCKIMGWGLTRPDGGRFPGILQEATVPILSNTECVVHYGDVFQSDMICVGANGVSCWKGDGGGSLACKKNGVWVLVGIMVSASDTCPTRLPMMAVRVSNYRAWIRSTVALN